MPNFGSYFHDRLDYLGSRKRQIDNVEAWYVPRGQNPFRIFASVGKTTQQEPDANGFLLETDFRDYIVSTAEFPLIPQPGDVILDGELRCEVMRHGDNPPYNYTTQRRHRMRIHTKVVSSVQQC